MKNKMNLIAAVASSLWSVYLLYFCISGYMTVASPLMGQMNMPLLEALLILGALLSPATTVFGWINYAKNKPALATVATALSVLACLCVCYNPLCLCLSGVVVLLFLIGRIMQK